MSETIERARPESCLSDLILDRLLAGELDGSPGGADAEQHLAQCGPCQARRQALLEESSRFGDNLFVSGLSLQAMRAAGLSAQTMRTAGSEPAAWQEPTATMTRARPARRRWWPMLSGLGVAAAAALLLLRPNPFGDGGERTKGAPLALSLLVRHGDGRTERVLPGGLLRPGEAIRFELSSQKAGYAGVLGLDAAPAVTAYAPAAGPLASLPAGRAQLLEGSVILDDMLGVERIVAVVCPTARSRDELLAAARRALGRAAGNPSRVESLDSGCDEALFTINKVQR